jgi:malate synthase
LFDFGLFFFHNAKEQLARGAGPFFYLPKIESHLEARLWNDVFDFAETGLGLGRGAIKATVLIETLPAAFEMDEILYELRSHSAGLNRGRWDYISSASSRSSRDRLPDRAIDDGQGLSASLCKAPDRTRHRARSRHGRHGSPTPIKNDPCGERGGVREGAPTSARGEDGHDGTRSRTLGSVPWPKRSSMLRYMKDKNQPSACAKTFVPLATICCAYRKGTCTDEAYGTTRGWACATSRRGSAGGGCVPLYHLMEDAATAEISRAQVWQQVKAGAVSVQKLEQVRREELASFDGGRFAEANALFHELTTADTLDDFLTLPAYERLLELETSHV